MPSINKLPTEIQKLSNEFFTRYAKNFKLYISKIGRKAYKTKCDELGVRPMYSSIDDILTGRTNFLHSNHYTQCSYISKLPVGMWLMADMEFYESNLMIKMVHNQAEVAIGANYVTDGVFLFGKNLATPVPLGTSFQKEIDLSFDTRNYIRK